MQQENPTKQTDASAEFLSGGGELGARMRAIDWSQTSLGPASEWPQSLKTCLRIILTSRQPMFVWWGEDLINLYNDAYKSIVGGKHPWALGQPASVVWREIWDEVGPRATTAIASNEGTYDEALLLIMERYGYPEETYYTFSYSPVPNDEGGNGGILCANTEDTQRILGERQLALLRDLASAGAEARTYEEACTRSARSLGTNPWDLPFAAIYLVDRERGRVTLAASAGIEEGHPALPREASLNDATAVWPFAAVVDSNGPIVIPELSFADDLPRGAWDRAPRQAVAMPIAPSGSSGKAGILIVGLSPFRLYDESYRGFVELVASQIAATIGNAQAYEDERKRAEALAEIDRAKTTFFSNVSHEFRTPLTLMLGPLEDILAKPEDEVYPENRELIRVMHRNGQRLLKLVNTLLDFSRIEAGRIQASYEPTDLATYTAELASVFRAAVEKAGMRLRIDAPALEEAVYVDRDMWEKIVLNLVSNAFKYTLEGEIVVSVRAEEGHAVLEVRDTGIGIPSAELPRLFNRFHRVEGARGRTHEGTGIGLALVQELARLHGGTVSVTSVEGSGSAFVVAIPLGADHLPSERIRGARTLATTNVSASSYVEEALRWLPEAQADPSAGASDMPLLGQPPDEARRCIILADDNADMRDYVSRLLSPSYDVTAVGDGAEALRLALARKPDLILTDVMMPNLDGFGLLRELRARPETSSIPVIMLSARAGEEAKVEGLEAGADDYLVKPFSARELLARVGGMLAIARVRETERRRLREIFERAPAFIATLRGPTHIFEVANPLYLQLVGEDREIIGRSVREALPEAEEQGFPALLDSVYRTGVPYVGRSVPVRLDHGENSVERFIDFVYQPIVGDDGEVAGIFVHGNDVTEQVRARNQLEMQALELRLAKDALQIADRRKDEFIATLSHELRTPLTAILGWARMLRMPGNDDETIATAIETINRSAEAQSQLIDDVLDISRITTGNFRIASESVDLATVAASAVETVRLAAAAKGIQLTTQLHGRDALVLGDANRLQQVLWNLLSNAIKFTPAGGEVRFTISRRGNAVIAEVEDTGMGISGEFLPHVFEPFRQANSAATRVHGGLGLGLSIVRYLVEMHGGSITAESRGEGLGSTFRVELPRLRATTLVPDPRLAAEARDDHASAIDLPDLSGLSLLVIDDQADVRDYIVAVLRRSGAEVSQAKSVEEAIVSVEAALPDLVLCDLAMPHKDGFEFVRWLREQDLETQPPVLAITAFGRENDEVRVREAGFDGYIRKPVTPEDLARAVTAARPQVS